MDKDFGALIYLHRIQHAGLIRLPHVPSADRLALSERILEEHASAELEGAIVTMRGNRMRISRRPRT
jgi:hypothetical protein